MTAVVDGLPRRFDFFSAQREAVTQHPFNLPDLTATKVVDSLLYKRLEQQLKEQQHNINAEKQADIHTHNISVKAEVPLNELKAILQAIQPSPGPSPPSQTLPAAGQQQTDADFLRFSSELSRTMELHAAELKHIVTLQRTPHKSCLHSKPHTANRQQHHESGDDPPRRH